MSERIIIKSESQRALMRAAGELTGRTLNYLEKLIKSGITTKQLDEAAEAFIRKNGGTPSFLNYDGFPGSICTSVNSQIVHGIPSKKVKLKDGDIISIDCGVMMDGYHGDAARTFLVGEVDPEIQKLVEVTRECFFKGLEIAVPGNHVSDISRAIEKHALDHGYGIVRELVGHGIGAHLHEAPEVPNFTSVRMGRGARLMPGMAIAIEPMINLGSREVRILDDGWTCVTADGKPSAHYENTVFITKDGNEVLTNPN